MLLKLLRKDPLLLLQHLLSPQKSPKILQKNLHNLQAMQTDTQMMQMDLHKQLTILRTQLLNKLIELLIKQQKQEDMLEMQLLQLMNLKTLQQNQSLGQ